ncbi:MULTISPECIES: hypothetical protein [unclassified Salinibacterium]|uniref:hypothetical protein n=1 Tax=unclassified Salinibacterium TaxID=2632331 RepID=UPI0018CF15D7|nr:MULTISPECIES: hypothetical protein [unclassified Salinibacterium]MBH0053825.1 hypothetical protein [Salinibacterium sp. SWN139]MBH0083086.1 hypothetical protein [Salinibacterium sp. SWN167]MBH0115871.1 hypothetical protein [Salinibacterium sp. NG253]
MKSWRDALNAEQQADVDRILDSALNVARSHLGHASEFMTFALMTDGSGRVLEMTADEALKKKHLDAEKLIAQTVTQLRQMAAISRCSAIVSNTRVASLKSDAIEVRIEHKAGAALMVLLPYTRARFTGALTFGDLKLYSHTAEVWV